MHNAAGQLAANVASQVSAAVTFGDPNNGDAIPNIAAAKTKVICNAGDNICDGGILILIPHLTVRHLSFDVSSSTNRLLV